MTTTWNQVKRYLECKAANVNSAPIIKIKMGKHTGRVDLNATRKYSAK